MKKLWFFALVFAIAAVVMLLLPLHMQTTGVVLLALSLTMAICALLWRKPSKTRQTAISILAVLSGTGVIALMAAMGIITSSGASDWETAKKSDFAIVLGAAVQENGAPSRIMRNRLEATLEFMKENPTAFVILSGGKGSDEPASEAKCMYDTLESMGADTSRLIMEDQSTSTRENILNSMELIEKQGGAGKTVTLITSEFHQFRAEYIASSLGLSTCPVSGKTDRWFYRVNYTLREVFAMVKAAVQQS